METILLTRKNLYEHIWTEPIAAFCLKFDVPEEGVEEICSRLNVPMPGIGHWRKLKLGKRSDWTPLPTETRGTESVVLYKRNDDLLKEEHVKNIRSILVQAGNTSSDIKPDEKFFDKLIQSTKEGMFKHWQVQHTYREKNTLLAIDVSLETSCRALQIMDLFIKLLRFKGFDIAVDQRDTFALIDGERISISLREKKTRNSHPTGCLYFRKEGRHSNKRDWKDGKMLLEDQLLVIFHELLDTAKKMKEERARMKKAEEEREAQAKLDREFAQKQSTELERFRQLLFEAHRFSLSSMVRTYIDRIEQNAIASNSLNEETREWISWARRKMDWFDPSFPAVPDELLNGIDIENLRRPSGHYSGYNYYNSGNGQTRDHFWKPWWSK
jgi:hypothetical protein